MQTWLVILLSVLLALLVLLLLLLICPVWVTVQLKYDQLLVKVRVLGLSFKLYPLREVSEEEQKQKMKHKKTKKKKEKKPKPEQQDRQTPSKRFEINFGTIVSLVNASGSILRRALAALKFCDIKVVLPLHTEDAAKTALFYGKFSAFFYSGIAVLQNILNLKFESIELIPDFAGDHKYRRSFYCKIGSSPLIMLGVGIYAFKVLRREHIL